MVMKMSRKALSAFVLLILPVLILVPVAAPVRMQGNPTPDPRNDVRTIVGTNFNDLTFGTSPDGNPTWYFPSGTQEIFARWYYHDVPQGATLNRKWYRNNQLFLEKSEPWKPEWGTTGVMNHISIYDHISGLLPGNYYVLISLNYDYPAAQISNVFTVADAPAQTTPPDTATAFTNLSVSDSAADADQVIFPAGTPSVSVRWNYANIPVGAVLERDWYFNGVLFRTLQETWSAYWGSTGRLTHIALYDYQNSLPAGNYRIVVFLRDMPSVQAQTKFIIGSSSPQPDGSQLFSNLTLSTSPAGPTMGIFPQGTQQIFARWDFAFVPSNTVIVRRWLRYGAPFLVRQEAWTRGEQGSVNDISIYDFESGLLPGNYMVEISLVGFPNSVQRAFFTIS